MQNKILEQIDELEDIRCYDSAKAANDRAIPFEQATKEIEAKRNDL